MMRNYRTSKGTELPLLNLRGKEYLEVKYRLVWFREDHPDWSIETELLNVTDVSAYSRATIRDESGRVIATSHKFESVQGFPDFLEKAETGAIGRALALIGYGTQFCADELDEGSRIVDAPVASKSSYQKNEPRVTRFTPKATATPAPEARAEKPEDEKAPASPATNNASSDELPDIRTLAEPGEYLINFGRKYKGRKLKEIPKPEIQSYITWLESSGVRPGTALAHQVKFLKTAYETMYGNEKTTAPSH